MLLINQPPASLLARLVIRLARLAHRAVDVHAQAESADAFARSPKNEAVGNRVVSKQDARLQLFQAHRAAQFDNIELEVKTESPLQLVNLRQPLIGPRSVRDQYEIAMLRLLGAWLRCHLVMRIEPTANCLLLSCVRACMHAKGTCMASQILRPLSSFEY